MNGKATHMQHIARDKVRYGNAVLSHGSSLLLCYQVGGRHSVSQTSCTPNQATSASTISLIRYRYHQFQISWPKSKLMAVTPNPTNHLPLKICNMEVQFVDSFTYIGSLITNDVAMYGLSNPLFRTHRISIRTKINMYRALIVSDLLYGSEAWSTTLAIAAAWMCSTCAAKGASCVRSSGSSTSATEASVNASSNRPHHISYDNAAYAGSHTSYACHPPSRHEWSMTSTQTLMAGKDQEVAQKLDGLIPSSTTSILLASTPPMLPRWYVTDPFVSGLPTLEPNEGY